MIPFIYWSSLRATTCTTVQCPNLYNFIYIPKQIRIFLNKIMHVSGMYSLSPGRLTF